MNKDDIIKKYSKSVPVPVVEIAKELGLKVFETNDFKDSQSGLIKKEGDDYVVYLNARHAETRKRFTLAHEIGHFLLHKNCLDVNSDGFVDLVRQPSLNRSEKSGTSSFEDRNREVQANQFAAELLMPKDNFITHWNKADDIEIVAKKFKVSSSAAAIRAEKISRSFIS